MDNPIDMTVLLQEIAYFRDLEDEFHMKYMQLSPQVNYHWVEYDRLSNELHELELSSDGVSGKVEMRRLLALTWINEQPEEEREKWTKRLEAILE